MAERSRTARWRTALDSTPPSLGIDLYGVCNVKPPCVYCEWDHSKDLEGDHVDTPFTRETLDEWGAFFDNAVESRELLDRRAVHDEATSTSCSTSSATPARCWR